jgi:threonine aldolase
MEEKLSFVSDYMEGAHPAILKRLLETNLLKTEGYGGDAFSESARNKIRAACQSPEADVYFLTGGTQTNAVMIDSLLRPYQGVIASESGHISMHEAGAIEYGGHKVLALPHTAGKISADGIERYIIQYRNDVNHEHMVMPGMVYLSQPTEYGTLYSLDELKRISGVCRKYQISLYVDGARLAYALSCRVNDVTLPDLAALCDAFYIGGTKCGALFGEAVVIPRHGYIPHLFTMIKQHGAHYLQRDVLQGFSLIRCLPTAFMGRIGVPAIAAADAIRKALREKGYPTAYGSPTNQIFVVLDKEKAAALSEKVELGFWENADDSHVIMRIATSWATQMEDVERLTAVL